VFHRNYGAKIPESHALLTVNRHGGTAWNWLCIVDKKSVTPEVLISCLS
jgi:hypothetical protein